MTYCKHCAGKLESDDLETCPHCGGDLRYSPPAPKVKSKARKSKRKVRVVISVPHKSPGIAALIAFIGAIFGFAGIGHIYVGRIGRGLIILVSGFALFFLGWIALFGTLFGAAFGGPRFFSATGAAVPAVFALMYVGLMVWQIFNARSCAKQHNEQAVADFADTAVDSDSEAA